MPRSSVHCCKLSSCVQKRALRRLAERELDFCLHTYYMCTRIIGASNMSLLLDFSVIMSFSHLLKPLGMETNSLIIWKFGDLWAVSSYCHKKNLLLCCEMWDTCRKIYAYLKIYLFHRKIYKVLILKHDIKFFSDLKMRNWNKWLCFKKIWSFDLLPPENLNRTGSILKTQGQTVKTSRVNLQSFGQERKEIHSPLKRWVCKNQLHVQPSSPDI